jgi:shikimate dehydrogenase
MPITGRTSIVGIFGDPVEHSLSPAMHNAALAAAGLDWVYVPLRVRPADLGPAVAGVRAMGFTGLNVTVPHKETIIPFLDAVSAEARGLGAVNTVVRRGRRLVGHNTDSRGFEGSLRAARVRLDGRAVLMVGAGGAARAVAAALVRSRCGSLTIVNRTRIRAQRLARQLGARAARVTVAPWEALADEALVRRLDVIVNCTSVGLHGEPLETLAYEATADGCVFVDLVYRRDPTPFLARARRLRRRTVDGLGMLLHQGALAFTLWTGRRAPLAVMTSALRRAAGGRRGALTREHPGAIARRTAPRRRRS